MGRNEVFESMLPAELWDRLRGSGAATPRLGVSGFPPTGRAAPGDAAIARHRVADSRTRPGGARRVR